MSVNLKTRNTAVVVVILIIWVAEVVASINFARDDGTINLTFRDIFITSMVYGFAIVLAVWSLNRFQRDNFSFLVSNS